MFQENERLFTKKTLFEIKITSTLLFVPKQRTYFLF